MNEEKFCAKISKFGKPEVVKTGYVFTLLITGTGLSNWERVNTILALSLDYVGLDYPLVEVMINGDNFMLIVLRPK